MKKVLFIAVAACGMFLASCGGDCYTCTVSGTDIKTCKDDYVNAGGSADDWADIKAAAIAAGCTE